jgi:hypothetical protein
LPAPKRPQTPLKKAGEENAALKQRVRADEQRLADDYREVFSTPHGERVFEDLIKKTGVFSSSFTGNSRGMYLQGQQAVGLYLLKMRDLDSPAGLRNWLKGFTKILARK